MEPVPDFSAAVEAEEGVLLAPVRDIVRMKLVSYRLKDRVHIQDRDRVGLITREIEAELRPELRLRLDEIRARMEAVLQGDLPELNRRLVELGIQGVSVKQGSTEWRD